MTGAIQSTLNTNFFKIITTLSTPFSLTSGGVNPTTTTVSTNHNQGQVPLTFSTVTITTISNGTPGIYPVPFFIPGIGGGTTNVFVMLSFLRVSGVDASTISFQIGTQAPNLTFAGTVTTYVLQVAAT